MKKAVLVVSYGSVNKAAREKSIDILENEIRNRFSSQDFFRAYSSDRVIKKIKEKENLHIDNPLQALEKIYQQHYTDVVVCSLHILAGEEYKRLQGEVESYKNKFNKIKLCKPLLSSMEGYLDIAAVIKESLPILQKNEAVVFVGHGTTEAAQTAYPALEYVLQDNGLNAFVGTLEYYPTIPQIIKKLEKHKIESVLLTPFLLVAGYHATNDIAGCGEDSWKTKLEKHGYKVRVNLSGLAENPAIRKLFINNMDDCANKIVVGTRGSNLAITQTKWVIDQLQTSYPNANFEIKTIQTKGDLHLDKDLDKIGDKGLFVKEIEQQLLNKDIDMAVHSMKDMPTAATQGLALSSVFKREDVRDALVLRGGGTGKIADLPLGAKIGTGSKRRKYQLLKLRPDLNVVSIRGNVDTRIEKMQKEKLDGIILAAAGLKRIGREAEIGEYIDTTAMVPAVGQGALVAQTRETDTELAKMLDYIKDEKANVQITAERAFLKEIGGSCHLPSGAYAKIEKDHIFLTGFYGDSEGKVLVKKTIVGKVSEPSVLGAKLAKEILAEFTQDEQDEK